MDQSPVLLRALWEHKLDTLRAEVGIRPSGEAERTVRWIQATEYGRQGMPRIGQRN